MTTSPSRAGRRSAPTTSLREFYFPDFSLNVVTRMEVQGTLDNDDVWKVKAHGPTFDGRDFFRSLFSLGQLAEQGAEAEEAARRHRSRCRDRHRDRLFEVILRGLKLKLVQARRKADGARRARHARWRQAPCGRMLPGSRASRANCWRNSTDAGQAFKLIDFYPNIQGGRVVSR